MGDQYILSQNLHFTCQHFVMFRRTLPFCPKNWKKGLSDLHPVSHIPGYHPETTVPTSAQPLLPVATPNTMHGGDEPSGHFRSGFSSQSLQKSAALLSLPQECHLCTSLPPPSLTEYLAAKENEKYLSCPQRQEILKFQHFFLA